MWGWLYAGRVDCGILRGIRGEDSDMMGRGGVANRQQSWLKVCRAGVQCGGNVDR